VNVRLDQTLAQAVDDLERAFIERALEATGGHVANAAEMLGLSRKGLFLKRRRQGLLG
jgi:DNA-binding NtrC family response regulator